MTTYCEFCGSGPTCSVCGRRPRGPLARLWARLFWWLG